MNTLTQNDSKDGNKTLHGSSGKLNEQEPSKEDDVEKKRLSSNKQEGFRKFSESDTNDHPSSSSGQKDTSKSDHYSKLYPDINPTPKPILKDPLKDKIRSSEPLSEEPSEKVSESSHGYSNEKLKEIREKSKQKGDSYKDIFGTAADIETADSELTGSLSSLSAYHDTPKRSKTEILTGEAQADYIPTETKANISLEDVNVGSTADEWREEGKKKRGIFINLPIWLHRTILTVVMICLFSWLYFSQRNYVTAGGYDDTISLVNYIWISTFMGAEQRALQGTIEDERPFIMTRFRIQRLYDAVYRFQVQEKRLPKDFDEMSEKGFDIHEIDTDGWRLPFKIETFNNSLIIRSAGRDSQFKTRDDLTYSIETGLIIPTDGEKYLYP